MGVKRNLEESGILEEDSAKITEAEAALYDRQIRLWGMKCQKRLREAKLLFVGLNGVTAETVKNLTLIGIKQITIHDDTKVTEDDFIAHLFLSSDKLGMPRAESSVLAIRELNPNVKIEVSSGDIFSKSDEFYKEFHAIVATDCSVDDLMKLNDLTRQHNLQFYCTDVWGFYGMVFLDLASHTCRDYSYPEEEKAAVPLLKGPKKEKVEPSKVELTKVYTPLKSTLKCRVGSGLRKRVSKVFVLFHVAVQFQRLFQRYPKPESQEKDLEELKKLRGIVCERLGYDVEKITDEILSSMFGQISPVCAVTGGILANEIIKGITKDCIPVQNYFFFDGGDYIGSVESIAD